MKNKSDFRLETASIEKATDFVSELLKPYKCNNRDIVRAQLFVEETIVYWAEVAAENDTVRIDLRKRFNTLSLSLSYKGPPSDPLSLPDEVDDESEFGFIGQNILIGLSTVSYTYENGHNVVTFTLKEKGANPLASSAVAIAAAVACGLTFERFAPSLGPVLSNSILTPLSSAFFGLLNAFVIPFLFVSVIASIFNMENIAQVKRVFRILFSWVMGLTLTSAVITVLAAITYFPLQSGSDAGVGDGTVWTEILQMIIDIVPSNIFRSFWDGNTLQVIFLAVITGIVMVTLKGRFPIISKTIVECNSILSTLLDAICSFMPFVIFICIFNMLLSRDSGEFLGVIGVVALICGCSSVVFLICLLSVALIGKESPIRYLKAISPVLLIALSTASSSATFSSHILTASTKQGIREYLAKFSVPVGALFGKPFFLQVLFLLSLFVGQFYQVSFSMADILSLVVLCIILTAAVPPMPGMTAFLFTIIFNRYGIPLEGLAMAVTIDILLDYFITTGDVLAINVSMFHTERRLRRIEKEQGAAGISL